MKVRIWYDRPDPVWLEMDPPTELEGEALEEWILDNAPAREGFPSEILDWKD